MVPGALLSLVSLLPVCQAIDPAKHVALLVNEAAPGSEELARRYARRRGVPLERIVRVRTTTEETVERVAYDEQIAAPVRAWLAANADVFVLVPTRGVPMRIREAVEDAPPDGDAFAKHVGTIDAAALDRELELLRKPPAALPGWIESPAFGRKEPLSPAEQQLIVMRLDGPTLEQAAALIDLARHGELYGIEGTHLLDTRGLAGGKDGYAVYDEELRGVKPVFEKRGLALRHDDAEPVVDLSTLDRPAHVWAWYGGQLQAARPFRFAPGAVACHVHSFSADTLRDPARNWVGPLLARGATVVVGTVYEPLTAGFPTAPRFWELFLDGAAVGDALVRSSRYGSWMAVFVGDPLYAPYAPALKAKQAANRALALEGPHRLSKLLDGDDLPGAVKLALELAALDVPLEAAPDAWPLVREARGRSKLGRKGKGTLADLRAALTEGETALAEGDPGLARDQANEALERSGTSFEANLLLARALLALGKDALAPARLARQVDDQDLAAQEVEAEALLAAKGKAADALALAEKLSHAELAGRALAALERWDDAIARLAPLASPSPRAALALGRALVAKERFADAAKALRAALDGQLPRKASDLPAWEALLEPWAEALARARDPAAQVARATAKGALKVKAPSRKQAKKTAAEGKELALRSAGELAAPPAGAAAGPARVRFQSRRLQSARIFLLGPTALELELPSAKGGPAPAQELAIPAGVYELVLVEGAGKDARARTGTLRAGIDQVIGLGLDVGDAWYVP